MFPYPRRKELSVALYPSFLGIRSSLIQKTLFLSFIFRLLLTFRVDRLYLIDAPSQDFNFVKKILMYSITPPYL
ncbi:hypothetical protein HLB03_11585, partial [Acidianus sp. DSM 29099]|nr:hypothetical protein [Acidianus sp. RZ1]